MIFDWDETKNRINVRKHGIAFSTAARVFDDPLHLMSFDRIVDGEERKRTLGVVDGIQLLVVAHTYEDEDGDEHVRIISARAADAAERREYEEGD